jgi:hypothetical protein
MFRLCFAEVLVGVAISASLFFASSTSARSVTRVGDMTQAMLGHTLTRLPSGAVLAVATDGAAELFDPLTSTWHLAPSQTLGTADHVAVSMLDGRVWIAGGSNSGNTSARVEVYSEPLNSWSAGVSLSVARAKFTGSRLLNGEILVHGGAPLSSGVFGVPYAQSDLVSADGVTLSAGPPLPSARYGHTATLLSNGDLIVLGGGDDLGLPTDSCFRLQNGAASFSTCQSMPNARSGHRAVLLGNGRILVVGGAPSGVSFESTYDPVQNSWSVTTLSASQATNQTVIQRNGNSALVWGGVIAGSTFANAIAPRRYFSSVNVVGSFGYVDNPSSGGLATYGLHAAAELLDGRTLVSGGSDTFGCVFNTVLGCIAYGFLPSVKSYLVGRQALIGFDNVLAGAVPFSPDPDQRYVVEVELDRSSNPLPSGAIQVSDGEANCVIATPPGRCKITALSAGSKTYSFAFGGDAEYLPLTWMSSRPNGGLFRIERVGQKWSHVSATGKFPGGGGRYCGAYIPPVGYITQCDFAVDAGNVVTLGALAANGDSFVGWQGDCAGNQASCIITMPSTGSPVVRALFAPTAWLPLKLDIDANGVVDATTDGQLIRRFMSRVHDGALTQSALGNNPQRTSSDEIEDRLNSMTPLLDVDQNGRADAMTDGVVILRFLLGFRNDALTQNAIGVGARRSDPTEISAHLQSMMP